MNNIERGEKSGNKVFVDFGQGQSCLKNNSEVGHDPVGVVAPNMMMMMMMMKMSVKYKIMNKYRFWHS